MITREFNLYLHAGHSIPLVINVNQYDQGEQWLFTLFNADGTQYTPSSGAIVGIKSDNLGIINSGTVDGQGRVVISETQQMTASVGKAVFELVIDDGTHGTANFVVLVEEKPGNNADLSETDISMIEQAIEAASSIKPYGSPLVASTVAGMTDHDKVYVYVGSETGYTSGNWYYWDGSAWASGGVYNSVAVQTDTTLTLSGVAADAKKTGDEISDLKSQIAQGGLTEDIKQALMNLVNHVGFDDDDPTGQTYITALQNALYPAAELVSISAVYTQGGTVYDSDSLDSLRNDLVVTAHYDDSTSEAVSNYTLSGTLVEGTSTITVTYGGKTTTFTVTVTASPVPSEYTIKPWVASLNTGTGSTYFVNTQVTPSKNGAIKVEIGFMMTSETAANKYFVGINSATGGGGQVGCGVYVKSDNVQVGAFNGVDSLISPNGESSMLNQYCNVTAEFTSTTSSITDGTLSADNTGTGRTHNAPIYLFGLKHTYNSEIAYPASGRIYYAKVYDGGTLILDLIPCSRNSDDKAGFYDVVNNRFITGDNLTAGA